VRAGGRLSVARRSRAGRRSSLRRLATLIAAGALCVQAGYAPAVAAATKPPIDLPVQPGTPNQVGSIVARPAAPIVDVQPGGGFAPDPGSARTVPTTPQPPSKPTEVPGRRDEFQTVVANPDGTSTITVNAGRVNYQDAGGAWQPIDTTLVPDVSDGFTLRTKANDVVVRINPEPKDGQVAVVSGKKGIGLSLRVPNATGGALTPTNDAVSFAAVNGVHLRLQPTPEGLDYAATIDDPSATGTFEVVLDTGGLKASMAPDRGSIMLTDATGMVVAVITAPYVTDAANVDAGTDVVKTTLSFPDGTSSSTTPGVIPGSASTPTEPTASPAPSSEPAPTDPAATEPAPSDAAPGEPAPSDAVPSEPAPSAAAPSEAPPSEPKPAPDPTLGPDEVRLTYTIDPAWLADPTRAYPVILDPTIQADGVGSTNCDSTATNYFDDILSARVDSGICSDRMRIGYDPATYGTMRGLFWFKGVALGDGEEITDADFELAKYSGASRSMHTALITGKGYTTPAKWSDQYGEGGSNKIRYLCADGIANNCSDGDAMHSGALFTPDISTWFHQDVTKLVRRWYTRFAPDWRANLGLMTKISNETTSTLEDQFRNGIYSAVPTSRPKLVITTLTSTPQVKVAFDTAALGPDFAPSTLPAGKSATYQLSVTNVAGPSWPATGTDHYAFGYRWLTSKGKLVVQTGFTATKIVAFAGTVASGTSTSVSLTVDAPPSPGQYTLRLDLVHVIGTQTMWASDWALPSKYQSRNKKLGSTPTDTRWLGSSVVENDSFSMSVTAGAGTAAGELEQVATPDGGSVGVNLWSHNLTYQGSGGVGFDDLGGPVGLSYYYNSADTATCTLILKACGWGTNYDERIDPGSNGADYVYRDPSGNRYFASYNGDTQLLSAAPARIERVRTTLFDENTLSWSVSTPTRSTSVHYNGASSWYIPYTDIAESTDFPKFSLTDFRLVSFASYTTLAGKSAMGFRIHDNEDNSDHWFFYTNGGTAAWAVGAFDSKWTGNHDITGNWYQYLQLNLFDDAQSLNSGLSNDLTVNAIDIRGTGSGGGFLYYDALRFEGRNSGSYDEIIPVGTTCGGGSCTSAQFSLNADHVPNHGTWALKAASSASPQVSGLTFGLGQQPYLNFSWKKVGGATVALAYTLRDPRDSSKNGTIYYYAGVEPTSLGTAQTRLKVSDSLPERWTTVTRNILEDARQALGMYNDNPPSSPTTPGSGPLPDDPMMTAYQFLPIDGSYALYDWQYFSTIPDPDGGDLWGATAGDDFLVGDPGGIEHHFNRDGLLTEIDDLDGNKVSLEWSYDFATKVSTLAKVHAPSDTMNLSSGTADREIVLTSPTNAVRFTEALSGVTTGRYTEFDRTGTDLTSVIPARRSASCAAAGTPSGCLVLGYDVSHNLISIRDPRSKGAGNDTLVTTIGWSGADPTTINQAGNDVLRVKSFSTGTGGSMVRAEWQDADGIATPGPHGYTFARFADLSPNGTVVTEYAATECASANCATATPGEVLATYTTDGQAHYTTETRYRLPAKGGPVTTRRGTLAAAAIDNYADPLTAGLTAWTQSAEQIAASTSTTPGTAGFVSTTFTYNAFGQPVTSATAYTNPATSTPVTEVTHNLYDDEGHLTQVDDNGFLANPGFEAGLTGWTTTTGATAESAIVHPGSSFGSLKLTGSGTASQIAALLPGQTARFQSWVETPAGGTLTAKLEYWTTAGGGSWAQPSSAWTITDTRTAWGTGPLSYDVTVPLDAADGRLRLTYSTSSGATSYVDDVALFTTFHAVAYTPLGLTDKSTDVLGHVTKLDYQPSLAYPAIFPTSSTANYVAAGSSTADQNVVSSATFDSWGRVLVTTDPDSVVNRTFYAANQTDVEHTEDGLANATRFLYDAIGQRTSVETPLHEITTTQYSFFGNAIDMTGPDSVATHSAEDSVGRVTSSWRNWLAPGTDKSGVLNIQTTTGLDENGRIVRVVGDAGGGAATSDATSDTAYDLTGQTKTHTVYPDGTSNARAVTTVMDPAGTPAGSKGPIVPTASGGPNCPDGSGECNAIATVDANGRTTSSIDVYAHATRTWSDFAGRPVRTIANDQASGSGLDINVTTSTSFDPAGHVTSVVDPLGHVTTTTYDNLDRIVKATRPDSTAITTTYTAGGRVALVSRPYAGATPLTWSKNVYDAAGRLATTIANVDVSGAAQYQLEPFESSLFPAWTTTTGDLITGGATLGTGSACALCPAHSGLGVRSIATNGSASGEGVRWTLSGTFIHGQTYQGAIWVRSTAGTASVVAKLGTAASSATTATPVTPSTTWQKVAVSWTVPAGPDVAQAYFALSFTTSAAVTVLVDDASVWSSLPADVGRNIPSTTMYDADGHVVLSVAPPGLPGDGPQITTTTYDVMGRVGTITVNAIINLGATADANLDTTYAYDAVGDRTDVTDPSDDGIHARVVTHYTFDRVGNVTASTLNYINGGPENASQNVRSTFAYDDLGELLASCEPQQVQTPADGCATSPSASSVGAWRYIYDANGSVLTAVPPTNTATVKLATTTNVYDNASGGSRLLSTTDSNGTTIRHTNPTTWDALGRVLDQITYSGSGTGTPSLETVVAFDQAGQRTDVTSFEYPGGSRTQKDTLHFDFDLLGRTGQIKRGTTVVTAQTYNPDNTTATRTDTPGSAGIGAGPSNFTYDVLGRLATASSPLFSGSVGFSWRMDGLLAGRTWPSISNAATVAYDGAKRPTNLTETHGTSQATFDRTYDRRGDVKTETQTIPSVSGPPASGQQSFTYDALHRVLTSALGSETRAYTYDASSNRLQEIDAGATNRTTSWTYDKTDEILTQKVGTGIALAATYDAFGNLVSAPAPDGTSPAQVSVFDKADHLVSVGPSGGTQTVFTIDALGRHWTRKVGTGATDTYTYAGASEAVVRIEQSATVYTDSALDANADRLATKQTNGASSVFGWLLPDLHGDIAAGLDSSGTNVTDAFRYDSYGKLIGTPVTTGPPSPWRYQGRLLETTPGGSEPDLYDFGFRAYSPTLGAFTSLDDVSGSAQNPLSLNRFLYAAANPETLVDPDGHCLRWIDDICADHQETPQQHYLRAHPNIVRHRPGKTAPANRQTGRTPVANSAVRLNAVNADARFGPSTRDQMSAEVARNAADTSISPADSIVKGLSGVLWDNTAGFAGNLIDDAQHLDQIPNNANLVLTALTHPDVTLGIAGDDLRTGVDRFGKLPLDQQVRLIGDTVVAGAGPKVLGGRARIEVPDVAEPDITSILTEHVAAASDRFAAEGLTRTQEAALEDHPNLEAAFKGERIDTFAKASAAADPRLSEIQITARFRPGADFIDPASGRWWDITTLRQWAAHVDKYGEGGTILPYQ
jgi:RHS repeat-associated protein